MSVFIHDIATSVPDSYSDQQHIREVMKTHLANDRKTRAIIHRIYSHSGIRKRHSVLEDFSPNDHGRLFFNGKLMPEPGTAARNDIYISEARKLFTDVGKKLLTNNPHIQKKDITHVITVSCTGFFAPGPDYEVVKALDLNPQTHRFHVGFMGCYAVFPALKMAQSFCAENPDAVVLVISAELCSLHFQLKTELDNLLSASVFADGAAGMLISAKKPPKEHFVLHQLSSALAPSGEKDMAWTIGNSGFDMVLSTYVPDIIQQNMDAVIKPFNEQHQITKNDIDLWALHPGGRSILDKIEEAFQLQPDQISASRHVLSEFGNMSSATILFVLKQILQDNPACGQKIMSMAFGPGLTIDSGYFTLQKPE